MNAPRVVVAHPKGDPDLWEPVHPGSTTPGDARKLSRVLELKHITHEIWTQEQWNQYDDEIRVSLFDEDGNERTQP